MNLSCFLLNIFSHFLRSLYFLDFLAFFSLSTHVKLTHIFNYIEVYIKMGSSLLHWGGLRSNRCTTSSSLGISKNYFNLCPLTLNVWSLVGFLISIAPWGNAFTTTKGPVPLDLNFLQNRWSLTSWRNTYYLGENCFLLKWLSWKILALSLLSPEFS